MNISISISISIHRQLSLFLGGVEVGCHSRGGELRHWSDMLATPRFVCLSYIRACVCVLSLFVCVYDRHACHIQVACFYQWEYRRWYIHYLKLVTNPRRPVARWHPLKDIKGEIDFWLGAWRPKWPWKWNCEIKATLDFIDTYTVSFVIT